MAFRLRRDAEKWFSEIQDKGPIRTKFDLYYFCLLLGLITGRKSKTGVEEDQAPVFVDYFIEDYKPAQRMLVGLLIAAELKKQSIDHTEKDDIRRLIRSIVDPESPTNLTQDGIRLINSYASGGYDYLTESRESKPFTVEEFLRDYVGLVQQAVEEYTY